MNPGCLKQGRKRIGIFWPHMFTYIFFRFIFKRFANVFKQYIETFMCLLQGNYFDRKIEMLDKIYEYHKLTNVYALENVMTFKIIFKT